MFYYALKAVVYPMAPVFDLQANDGRGALTPYCVKALKRIFLMSDQDKARPLTACSAIYRMDLSWHDYQCIAHLAAAS